MARPTRDRYTAAVQHLDETAGTSRTIDHTVEITPADQLRGELEGHRQGLGPIGDAPLHYTVIWIWAALTRTHLYAEDFQTFTQRDLYAWGPAETEDGDVGPDPTQGSGRLEFDSSSPATTVTPHSG